MDEPLRFCYAYPHPAVTTDVVVLSIRDRRLELLLIRRAGDPFAGHWALPGGFLDIEEDLEQCAKRELEEETGVAGFYLEQLRTFGQPGRDPRERVISIAYFALVPSERLDLRPASDAAAAAWFPIRELPPLAFDHAEIIRVAHERLVAKLRYSTIAFQFLPETFTLGELQEVYEILTGADLDKRNFRKWVLTKGHIEADGEQRRYGRHRPARLFRLRHRERVDIFR